MWQRLSFVLATLFFIVMNVLLFMTEFGGRKQLAPVPAAHVWKKILTAPDNSFLEIQHHGKKIGTCQWRPTVGDKLARRPAGEEPPEGMVDELAGYNIELSGNFNLEDATRLGFNFDLKLSTNQAWQEFFLSIKMRPSQWDFRGSAAEETIRYTASEGRERSARLIRFAELNQPEKLLRDFGIELPAWLWPALGVSAGPRAALPPSLGLAWDARHDWLKAGHARLRVYRLQASVLGRFHAIIYVSPVGEILRVELPDEIVLLNRPDEYWDMEPPP